MEFAFRISIRGVLFLVISVSLIWFSFRYYQQRSLNTDIKNKNIRLLQQIQILEDELEDVESQMQGLQDECDLLKEELEESEGNQIYYYYEDDFVEDDDEY